MYQKVINLLDNSNFSKGKCVEILYGGCRATKNNFQSKENCKAVCPSKKSKATTKIISKVKSQNTKAKATGDDSESDDYESVLKEFGDFDTEFNADLATGEQGTIYPADEESEFVEDGDLNTEGDLATDEPHQNIYPDEESEYDEDGELATNKESESVEEKIQIFKKDKHIPTNGDGKKELKSGDDSVLEFQESNKSREGHEVYEDLLLKNRTKPTNKQNKGVRHLKFRNSESQKNPKISKASTESRINQEINKLAHDLGKKNHKKSIIKGKKSPPFRGQKMFSTLPIPENRKKSSKSEVSASSTENNADERKQRFRAKSRGKASGGVNQRQLGPNNRLKSKTTTKNQHKKKDICTLHHTDGEVTCMGATSRWFFDSKQSKCVAFTYGGCHGTENNFGTKKECEAACPSN